MRSEVTRIENSLAICLDQDRVRIVSRMVDEKWRNNERAQGDWFLVLQEHDVLEDDPCGCKNVGRCENRLGGFADEKHGALREAVGQSIVVYVRM